MHQLKKKSVVLMLPVLVIVISFGIGTCGVLIVSDLEFTIEKYLGSRGKLDTKDIRTASAGLNNPASHAMSHPLRPDSLEPSTIILFVGGLSGMAFFVFRKAKTLID